MNDKLTQAIESFNQLELRMRLMLTFAVAMIVGFIIDLFWLTPVNQKIDTISQQIVQLDKQIVETIEMQNELNQKFANNKNHPLRLELVRVESQLADAKSLLEEKALNLVNPNEMANVLKEIITRSNKLELKSLSKIAVQPLFESKEQAPPVQLYRHSVELVFDGGFIDTQKFLLALETMPKKVAFDNFYFTVEAYPQSEVKLVVSTLSFDRKWIGG